MRGTVVSRKRIKAHLDVKIWYQVIIFGISTTRRVLIDLAHLTAPWTDSVFHGMAPFFLYLSSATRQRAQTNQVASTQLHSLLSTTSVFFFLSWSLHFLVSPVRERFHQKTGAELVRTNLQRCSSRLAVPAVHRVVLSAEICYESSIRIQVSSSESGVKLPGVLCDVVMNVQSPVGRSESCCEMEKGALSTRSESKDPGNAGVGGNDCGISSSILVLRSV